ncbi:MAG: hypothetical protein ACRCX2_35915 [Paraclostridium sp.]
MIDDKLNEILGYELVKKEINKIASDPDVKEEVEKWLIEHIGKGHISSVKRCKVEYIEDEDIDDMDEFELKEFYSLVKKNQRHCPGYLTCPLYNTKTIRKEEKCTLELIETQYLIKGLLEELQIEQDDFNDQIIVGQLVSMNIVYNRAMAGLSATPLVSEIKTYTKGGMNIDTKINENFNIATSALTMMEKLRKSMLLNRDDKMKIKQIKKANDELSAKKRVEEAIKNIDEAVVIDDDIIKMAMGSSEKKETTENYDDLISDI